MFMFYSILIGVALGLALRGRLSRLGEVRLRWAPVALAGLATQVLLFSSPLTDVVGDAGPPIYVASMVVVLAVVARNLAVPGLPVVALGAASNLIAIAANGGYMPASPDALAALGKQLGTTYTNSGEWANVVLAPLTDIFAMPRWIPLANVFSVGDVLIGVGVVLALVLAMRDARLDPSPVALPASTELLPEADPRAS